MPVMRRVYGETDDNTFFAFRDRTRREGLSLAEAFSGLVKAYARGYVFVKVKQQGRTVKETEQSSYMADHAAQPQPQPQQKEEK